MYSQVHGGTVDSAGNDNHPDDPRSDDVAPRDEAPNGHAALATDIGASGDGLSAESPTAEAALAENTAAPPVPRPTRVMSLLAEIARAMQVAADEERHRIHAGVGEDEAAQIEKIHVRALAESDELLKHAEEDVSLVNAWRQDQIRRIREDADRQIGERRKRLEESLTRHGSLIETEVQSVQLAVQEYRASLDAFFGRLSDEREPSAIARLAGTLPDPPDLQGVRTDARSGAMRELVEGSATDHAGSSVADLTTGEDGHGKEPVGVMEPGLLEHSSGVAQADATVPSLGFADPPVWIEARSEIVSTESAPEPIPSHENTAVRLIRSLTGRTTSGSGDH